MKKPKAIFAIAVLTAVMSTGCSSSTKTETASTETTQEAAAAASLNRNIVVTVDFTEGQRALTHTTERQIEKAIIDARKMGKVKNVEVAAWSDMKYPVQGQTLPKAQVQLADIRAKSVEKLIDRIEPKSDVSTHNMAKQPNSFQKWVNSRDAEVKKKLVNAGITSDTYEPSIDRKSVAMVFIEVE